MYEKQKEKQKKALTIRSIDRSKSSDKTDEGL